MRIPKNRPPVQPGEVLREEFLRPLGITQEELASELGVSFQRVNGIVNGKRALTAETAVLLARRFKTSPGFWMNFQTRCDLYQAAKRIKSRRIGSRNAIEYGGAELESARRLMNAQSKSLGNP